MHTCDKQDSMNTDLSFSGQTIWPIQILYRRQKILAVTVMNTLYIAAFPLSPRRIYISKMYRQNWPQLAPGYQKQLPKSSTFFDASNSNGIPVSHVARISTTTLKLILFRIFNLPGVVTTASKCRCIEEEFIGFCSDASFIIL